jgi:prepilin-type N-terminal cleavage/methylation domain-containing protein
MAADCIESRRGFTLVETVMVVMIMGLMLAIAAPRFTAMRAGYTLDSAAYQLAGDLRRAQVEAVKRNQTVVVAKTGATTYNITFIGDRAFTEPGVAFGAPAMTVSLASFGPPIGGGATFTITLAGRTKTVTVGANGLITVQ